MGGDIFIFIDEFWMGPLSSKCHWPNGLWKVRVEKSPIAPWAVPAQKVKFRFSPLLSVGFSQRYHRASELAMLGHQNGLVQSVGLVSFSVRNIIWYIRICAVWTSAPRQRHGPQHKVHKVVLYLCVWSPCSLDGDNTQGKSLNVAGKFFATFLLHVIPGIQCMRGDFHDAQHKYIVFHLDVQSLLEFDTPTTG